MMSIKVSYQRVTAQHVAYVRTIRTAGIRDPRTNMNSGLPSSLTHSLAARVAAILLDLVAAV